MRRIILSAALLLGSSQCALSQQNLLTVGRYNVWTTEEVASVPKEHPPALLEQELANALRAIAEGRAYESNVIAVIEKPDGTRGIAMKPTKTVKRKTTVFKIQRKDKAPFAMSSNRANRTLRAYCREFGKKPTVRQGGEAIGGAKETLRTYVGSCR